MQWLDLERQPWKLVARSLADSGATGNVPSSTQTTPSSLCASRAINPGGKSYADGMWYLELGPQPGLTHFTYSESLLIPTPSDSIAPQAIEADLVHVVDGMYFDYGLQAAFVDGVWKIWNKSTDSWESIGVKCPAWSPGDWMNLSYSWHHDTEKVYYDSLTINDTVISLGQSYPPIKTTEAPILNAGFQLDGNEAGVEYMVYLDAVSVIAS